MTVFVQGTKTMETVSLDEMKSDSYWLMSQSLISREICFSYEQKYATHAEWTVGLLFFKENSMIAGI